MARNSASPDPLLAARPSGSAWPWGVALVVAAVLAYQNSFDGVFQFDGLRHVVERAEARMADPIRFALSSRRPIVELTFALNHALGGLDPWGYHLVNLFIHLMAGLALFVIVGRTLLLPRFATRWQGRALPFAFSVALLWMLHPVQTQSVTYVVQRGESLMGMFYLQTLAFLVRGATSKRPAVWYGLSILASGLGMASKGVMVSAPLICLLYDRVFLSASFKAALVRRRWLYAGLASTWLVLAGVGLFKGIFDADYSGPATVGFAYKGITPLEYLMTEPGVILRYLELALWPHDQAIDYGWRPVRSFSQAALPGAAVVALFAGSLLAFRRRPWLGFLGAWFFVILAPTSSIVPIKDPIFEHRMYLSLAAPVVLAALGIWQLAARLAPGRVGLAVALCAVPALALGTLTRARNALYASPAAMWQDVLESYPDNAPAHVNLGAELLEDAGASRSRRNEAIAHFRKAIRIDPDNVEAHYDLGLALHRNGDQRGALRAYRSALALDERHTGARMMLGIGLAELGDLEPGLTELRRALADLKRNAGDDVQVGLYVNMGQVLAGLGRFEESLDCYDRALAFEAANPMLWYERGEVQRVKGDRAQAERSFRQGLLVEPDHAPSRMALEKLLGGGGS